MHFVDAKGILSAKNGMNIYRGCTHGCIYCDSRSKCYNMQHDFEDIEVKQNAPILLEKALRSKRKKCMVGTGSMCDPYMHCEEKLGLTRKCLEIINQYEFGATLITKSDKVLRDLDIIKKINSKSKAVVQMTMTTHNDDLCRLLEPNVCVTSERFKALKILRENGIPTVVWISPLLPMINDTEENLCGILDYCFEAGVSGIICFGIGLTLREGNREYFYNRLERDFPGMKQRYIDRYGLSYNCVSDKNNSLMKLFHEKCESQGVKHNVNEIVEFLNEFPEKSDGQLSFFDL